MSQSLRAEAQKFRGTGVALVTPFLHSGAVDETSLSRLTEHVIDGEVDYLVLLGTTAEAATLTPDETARVLEVILDTNSGRKPILLGCGGNDTRRVVQTLGEWLPRYQPDGVMSVCPYYNRPSQEGMFRHFGAIAEACGDTPLILYNVPARTASNLLPETVLRLAAAHANIVGVKEASGSVEQAAEIIAGQPEGFLVLSGDDPLALATIALGAQGCISVIANALPLELSALVRHALHGHYEEARRLHYQLAPSFKLAFAEGNPTGIKALLAARRICEANVRLPLAPATEALRQKIDAYTAQFA